MTKKILLSYLIATVTISCFAQNTNSRAAQLFNINSNKAFKSPTELTKTYPLVFDSITYQGSLTIYHPYKMISDSFFFVENCQPRELECYQRNKPTWIGSAISQDGSLYQFKTHTDSLVSFNFNLAPLQAHIFYEDALQRFSITQVAPGSDTLHFGNMIDSVQRYQISHTDLQGNFINSPLNTWQIIIGKELGLISFFRIDSFPQVLTPLTLLGNTNPDAGLFELTHEMIYDFQPGDIIQTRHYWIDPLNPEMNQEQFYKDLFIFRMETEDSLTYYVQRTILELDPPGSVIDTISLKYKKANVLATIPIGIPSGAYYNYTALSFEDYCGSSRWTYTSHHSPFDLYYCEEGNSWCASGYDTFESYKWVAGLGEYSTHQESIFLWAPYSGSIIVYFRKNGLECGDEVVGLNEPPTREQSLIIVPNPCKDYFTIEGTIDKDSQLQILDANGKTLSEIKYFDGNSPVNISMLSHGIYLVRIISALGIKTGKLIVE